MRWPRSLVSVLVSVSALAGCNRANPNFKPLLGDELGGESEGEGEEASTLDTGDGDADTGEGDNGDEDAETGDGDADTGAEANPMDLPEELCSVETNAPLRPTFGDPFYFDDGECPVDNQQLVKVFAVSGSTYMVGLCPNSCGDCDGGQLHPLGAPGLSIVEFLAAPVDDPNPTSGCFKIEVEELVGENGDACEYSSLGVFPPVAQIVPPVFAAVRDDWGLTARGTDSLGNFFPALLETGKCGCDELDPQVQDCCPEAYEVLTFQLEVGEVIVDPGDAKVVQINGYPLVLHAVQGQIGFTCDADYEVSWALSLPD